MKVEHYNQIFGMNVDRRSLLKGAAGVAAMSATGALGTAATSTSAFATDDLRAAILKIPGVGKGQPGDAEWQKVGEMCLAATKAGVQPGEFKGVELSFMGLNNQNLHRRRRSYHRDRR
jgi:multiple sugar transport system substrate-binding protein